MLYSKNGSIPKPETDGTDGWVEVPEPPVAPAGKEVVWWCPPGWVVRDPKPAQSVQSFNTYDTEGNVTGTEEKLADWSWSQSQEQWVAHPLPTVENIVTLEVTDLSSAIAMSSAIDITDIGTAQTTTEV